MNDFLVFLASFSITFILLYPVASWLTRVWNERWLAREKEKRRREGK